MCASRALIWREAVSTAEDNQKKSANLSFAQGAGWSKSQVRGEQAPHLGRANANNRIRGSRIHLPYHLSLCEAALN
jgi:hypothetical protein